MEIPGPSWRLVTTVEHAKIYEIAPAVLVVAPHEGTHDTASTARECLGAQAKFFRDLGRRGATIVLMDAIEDQTAEARSVYQKEADAGAIGAFALVGGTTFGRAVGSVYLGLIKPSVPTKLFGSFEQALEWVTQRVGDSHRIENGPQ